MSGMQATTSDASRRGPLAGVRVVDLSINVLGPMATRILGHMGADIIKVETPLGDDNRRTGPPRSKDMSALFITSCRLETNMGLPMSSLGGDIFAVQTQMHGMAETLSARA